MTVIKKILWSIDVLLLLCLAVATGLVKLGIGPPEGVQADLKIFTALGFSTLQMQIFAGVQIAAGAFLLLLPTRRTGCLLLIATFAVGTVGLFLHGPREFAYGSVVFILMVFVPLVWVSPKRFGSTDVYS